jgi:altronate dehydratase
MKISANAATCSFLGEHIDVDVSRVMDNHQTMPEAADAIFERLLAVASGELTRAEVLGYTEGFDVYVRGPVI